jgi:hypothetical protein
MRSVLTTESGGVRGGQRWVNSDSTTGLMRLYDTLLASPTVEECQVNLRTIERVLIKATAYSKCWWLNNHVTRLVSCYIDQNLHYGLTATSKAEGAYRVIRAWLGGS